MNWTNANARIQSQIDNVMLDSQFIDSFNISLDGGVASLDVMNELDTIILLYFLKYAKNVYCLFVILKNLLFQIILPDL